MSIVKMKRIRLVGLLSERDDLIHELLLGGCVEISDLPEADGEARLPVLAGAIDSRLSELRSRQVSVKSAIEILDKYAPQKTGLFPIRKEITAEELFSDSFVDAAGKAAEELVNIDRNIGRLYTEASRLTYEKEALALWEGLDVPLGLRRTGETSVMLGSFAAGINREAVTEALDAQVPLLHIEWAGSSKQQQCAMLICHNSVLDEAVEAVRALGFSQISPDEAEAEAEMKETALARRRTLSREIEDVGSNIYLLKQEVSRHSDKRDELKLLYDRLEQEISKEEAKERLAQSGRIFALEGWISSPEQEELEKRIGSFTCAYEMTDPGEGDDVPVKLKSNRLTRPMNMVTEMYSLPVYTGIDPNGLIMPFFIVFFGIMYADLGYGLILIAISLISKKWKPRGMIGYMMDIMFQVGISTAVFGLLLGGFFGDLIPAFSETFLGKRIELWAIIDPLQDPMTIMIFSLILGAVQIIVGMAVKAYLCFRDGRPLDAFLDVGTWWLLFIGIGLWVMGYGYWVAAAGALSLVLTQGRNSPTIIGKLVGGIASLYDITGYLSDVLSYIRLMALMLATSVIASVVNLLGSMTGNVIGFIIVFLVGHALNMGINIVGTYVHTVRLQYLEFFGKFYEEGGRPFSPLQIKTKYHDITNS